MPLPEMIQTALDKAIRKNADRSVLQVALSSDKYGLHVKRSGLDSDTPFHVASVGKMVTASAIGRLCDRGLLKVDDGIVGLLPKDVLDGLFVHKGTDHRDRITLRDLLGHTSGVADYFESDVRAGSRFVDVLMRDPDRTWTPSMLIDFTRDNQTPFGPPGSFHYSDTGYVLLGLIIEAVMGRPFHDVLAEDIFAPLQMDDSYLMFRGRPKNPARPIAPIWFNGLEISRKPMLSCDWAGGGIVSTLDDLLKFSKAFWGGSVVSRSFLSEMSVIKNKFRAGMHYGLGMMELRFQEFFFPLRGFPSPKGHSGILGTHLYYDAPNDLHIVLNMGSNKKMAESIKLIIKIETLLKRGKK